MKEERPKPGSSEKPVQGTQTDQSETGQPTAPLGQDIMLPDGKRDLDAALRGFIATERAKRAAPDETQIFRIRLEDALHKFPLTNTSNDATPTQE